MRSRTSSNPKAPSPTSTSARRCSKSSSLDEALKAFEKAEKAGYNSNQVKLQKAGIHRLKGDITQARAVLKEVENQASHNAEYHFQAASCFLQEGQRDKAMQHFEKAVELDPSHTGALFQLGHANDLAGNDDDAIQFYERCLNHPPIHLGVLMNLGILYEDGDKYDKAVDCYRRILNARSAARAGPAVPQGRGSLADAVLQPGADAANSRFNQVLEIPVTDFELSVRSRNCLKKMNIRTLGDLTRVSEQQLLSSKNFGETSLNEIKEILTAKGLRVGQALEQGAATERRFVPAQQLSEAGAGGAEQAGQRTEPVGACPQVHESPRHRHRWANWSTAAPMNCSKRRTSA